jgi:hypothetical protein
MFLAMRYFSLALAAFMPLGVAVQLRERSPNSTLISVPVSITKGNKECPALNELPGLVPRKGALLGTIKATGSLERRSAMFAKHGYDTPTTHVFRFYKDLDLVHLWLQDDFVTKRQNLLDKGKIIWLDVMPKDWELCVNGGCDEWFKIVAQVLVSIKPAKAFLSIGHEVDHDWPGMTGGSEDYIAMVHRARDLIVKNGGDNAVWKFVISNQVLDQRDDSQAWNRVLERWPGDDYVDWIGFNVYLKHAEDNKDGTGTYVYGETYYTYPLGQSLQEQLNALTKKFKAHSKPGRDFASKTWELATIGVHSNNFDETFNDYLGNENLGVPDEFRIEFLKELKYVVESGKYTQFKSMAYFDSGDCQIDDVLVKPFYDWSTSDQFVMDHQCS